MGIEELTRREREVAEVAATGASTEAIAEQLCISRRTVESHLGAIYVKLGVKTRAALVAALHDGNGATGLPTQSRFPPAAVDAPMRARGVPDAPRTFVGREDELGRIRSVLDATRNGAHRAVLVGGAPGVGKSSLLGKLLAPDATGDLTVLAGRCDPAQPTPYGPLMAALAPYLLSAPDPLDAVTGQAGGALVSAMPGLAGRLTPLPAGTDASAAPRLVADAVAHTLAFAAATRPVVLVLEDLHWADLGTVAVLRHLITSARVPGLVLLATFRDTDLHREHPLPGLLADLWSVDEVVRLNLAGLSDTEALALARALAGEAVGAATVHRIHEQSAGNPLFLSLVIRHLAERSTDSSGDRGELPRGLHEVVLRWVRGFDPASERPLTVAAVAGLTFDLPVLRSTIDRTGGRLDTPLVAMFDGAVEAGLLLADDSGPESFRFVHDLVRLALLERVGRARRAQLHVALGKAMVSVYDDPRPYAAATAAHLSHSTDPADRLLAAQMGLLAAQEAFDRYAPADTAELARRALDWLPSDGDGDAGDLHLSLLLLVAQAEESRYDGDAHRAALLEAAAIARGSGRSADLARVAGAFRIIGRMGLLDPDIEALQVEGLAQIGGDDADSGLRATLMASIAYSRALGGEGFAAAALAQEACREADRSGDPLARAEAHDRLGGALVGSPDIGRRLAAGAVCQALSDELPYAFSPVVGRVFLAITMLCDGNRDGFDEELDAVDEASVRLRSEPLRAFAGELRHLQAMLDGRLDDAEEGAAAALDAAHGDPNFLLGWLAQMCALRVEQERGAEFIPMLRETVAEHGDLPAARSLAAWVWSSAGDHDAAAGILQPLLETGLAALPRDFLLPGTAALLTPTLAQVGTADARDALLELLEPYRGQVMVLGMGTEVLGTADGCSALLLAGTEPALAAEALDAGVVLLRQIGAPLLAANLLADFAELSGEECRLDEARSFVPRERRTPRLLRRLRGP